MAEKKHRAQVLRRALEAFVTGDVDALQEFNPADVGD